MCVAKAMGGLAGNACKAGFDKREFRKRKPFFNLEKGLRGNQLTCFLTDIFSFKKHLTKKPLYGLNQAIRLNKIYSAFSLSFCFDLPIILIEKQNNSKLVLHLGSREKMWQS